MGRLRDHIRVRAGLSAADRCAGGNKPCHIAQDHDSVDGERQRIGLWTTTAWHANGMTYLSEQQKDMLKARGDLENLIAELEKNMR